MSHNEQWCLFFQVRVHRHTLIHTDTNIVLLPWKNWVLSCVTLVQWFFRGHLRLMMIPKLSMEFVYSAADDCTVNSLGQGAGSEERKHTQTHLKFSFNICLSLSTLQFSLAKSVPYRSQKSETFLNHGLFCANHNSRFSSVCCMQPIPIRKGCQLWEINRSNQVFHRVNFLGAHIAANLLCIIASLGDFLASSLGKQQPNDRTKEWFVSEFVEKSCHLVAFPTSKLLYLKEWYSSFGTATYLTWL